MIKLPDITLQHIASHDELCAAAANALGVPEGAIQNLEILRRSIDARRKSEVRVVYSLLVTVKREDALISACPGAELYERPETYRFPFSGLRTQSRPIIAGLGPTGLFAALCLAEAGVPCLILERGKPVDERANDVARFWRDGVFDPSSNVQFGEGGAGTFSDGKLTTGISGKRSGKRGDNRVRFVLERLREFGAPEEILYLTKPHIGTDRLRGVMKAIREHLISLGCEVRFGHTLCDIDISGGRLSAVTVQSPGGEYRLDAESLILAPGNSARDTFEMLHARGVPVVPKSFSVGVRIEHRQRDIDTAQYGAAGQYGALPPSDYKLVHHLGDGRAVYTFCVCPGGTVVASSSETGGVVTNGMSSFARDSENCNGAVLVSVTPEDYGGGALSGIAFQRELERRAYIAGGGDYRAPAQTVGDFLARKPSDALAGVMPTYLPGVTPCNLWEVLPEFICEAIRAALPEFAKRVRAFADMGAVMTAVETRSSSPVRIERGDSFQAAGIAGLYPCGEGAGYAGGIMSSAVDGVRCAEALCERHA